MSDDDMEIVIVGAGQAGIQTALSLRLEGFNGQITLVGDETSHPYQRPPLSKAYLKGNLSREALQIVKPALLEDRKIKLSLGNQALAIDRSGRKLECHLGMLRYDKLVLATGAHCRTLEIPGMELGGVATLRTIEDADTLRRHMEDARRIAIVGAGFIGLEFAAVARDLGKEVTVIESGSRAMQRVVSKATSDFFTRIHREKDVSLYYNEEVSSIAGENGKVREVELLSGKTVPTDLVVIGIGAVPNTSLAKTANLKVANGILVDRTLQTSDPHIFAIGDCCSFPGSSNSTPQRIETIQNAIDQAKHVAHNIMGSSKTFRTIPWFWSDQYNYKLQIVGLSAGADSFVIRGAPEAGKFSTFLFREDQLICVESVNSTLDHVLARKAFSNGIALTRERLSNTKISFKEAIDEAMPL